MLKDFNKSGALSRAERFGIDPKKISSTEIPKLDFKGELLNPNQALAIALESKIAQCLALRNPYRPEKHIKIERED